MRSVSIRIAGRVQGVFFRASTKSEADRLAVHGIVRNEPDGSVYIEAEGEDHSVSQFIDWCRKGPSRARVLTFVMEEKVPAGYVGFRIER